MGGCVRPLQGWASLPEALFIPASGHQLPTWAMSHGPWICFLKRCAHRRAPGPTMPKMKRKATSTHQSQLRRLVLGLPALGALMQGRLTCCCMLLEGSASQKLKLNKKEGNRIIHATCKSLSYQCSQQLRFYPEQTHKHRSPEAQGGFLLHMEVVADEGLPQLRTGFTEGRSLESSSTS